MITFYSNVLSNTGDLQLYAGHSSRWEAAMHALSSIFNKENCDEVLIVFYSIAFLYYTFNRLNSKVMLHNIRITCPIIATHVTYT